MTSDRRIEDLGTQLQRLLSHYVVTAGNQLNVRHDGCGGRIHIPEHLVMNDRGDPVSANADCLLAAIFDHQETCSHARR